MKTSGADARLEVRLLGRFELKLDGQVVHLPSRPAQSLFAYLILSAGTTHRREKLAAMLWPDADEENGRSYLRHALWRIRKAVATEPPSDGYHLMSDDLSVGFDPNASYWLDVAAFERGSEETVDGLMASVRAYGGELLPGFYDEWVVLERERLEAVLPRKMQGLIDRLSAERRWPELVEWAERWIALGGVPESAYRALMLAHHGQGDRARLAAAYQRCVEALKRELDVVPSDQTRELYGRLSHGAASTAVGPEPRAPSTEGIFTFLFSDLRDYTAFVETHGDAAATALIAEYRRLVRAEVARTGGGEVKTEGDSFYVVFPSARQALRCAIGILKESERHTQTHPDRPIRVGIGVNAGEPVPHEGQYVGSAVNIAARLAQRAGPGELLVTDVVRALLRTAELPPLREREGVTLKGVADPPRVFAVSWQETLATSASEEAAPAAPPFKGLHHFDEADADLFFGREALVARLVDRLRENSFLAVVGASGSGKSSIVRAGMVPALRATGGREIHVITPTAHPLEALAASLTADAASTAATAALLDDLGRDPRSLRLYLRRSRRRVLLLVDQLEELFTLCRDAFEREAFVDNLLAAAEPDPEGPARLVIALRADFYVHCADHPALRNAIAQHQEYVGPMDPQELRRAIEGPAAKAGLDLEPGLIDALLRDVGDEPGALPLLSHALLETWHRRRGRALTLEGYAQSGGVRGAIARTAESVFARLTPAQQALARRIFLRLSEFGEGTQETRRRASLDELRSGATDPAAVTAVLRVLADARLITTGARSVDVAHEALIREWPRLRQWLDEDREALRVQRALTTAALEWDRLGRDPGALYRGVRLVQALDRARADPDELNELERAFLNASLEHAETEEREREAARQRELEAARRLAETERSAALRLRRRALYLTVALFFLAGMAGAALFFAEQARASAAAAELEQRRALLESARSAAANVDSRLKVLRDAMSASATAGFMYLVQTSDPSLPNVLFSMRNFGGDVVVLFVTQYRTNEIVAPGDYGFDRPLRTRAERARNAVARSAPDAEESCKLLLPLAPGARASFDAISLFYMSAPYAPAPGDTPSVAMVKYDERCSPYALIAEVSLRRAGEWMAGALAPDDDAYLIDQAGRLLAGARHSEADYFRDLTGSDLVAAGLASPEAFLRHAADPLDGEPRLAAMAPVGETGWRVIIVRSASAAQHQLEASLDQLRLLGALLAVLLVAVSAVALVIRRARPAERAS